VNDSACAAGQGLHATYDACERALPHILAAPKDNALIEQVCFRPDYCERAFPQSLELTVEHGIIGERWGRSPWLRLPDGAPDPRIQVSILAKRVMDLCWRDRDHTVHPGDPIVADMDLGMDNLPIGSRLRAGTAVLEVSDVFNTGCAKWRDRYGGDSLRWINEPRYRPLRLRGILCRIVRDGRVAKGALLTKDSAPAAHRP